MIRSRKVLPVLCGTIAVFFLAALSSCGDAGAKVKAKTPSMVSGSWTYSFPFYSSAIHLDASGRFTFLSDGCLGTNFSEGTWTFDGTYVTLTSGPEPEVETAQGRIVQSGDTFTYINTARDTFFTTFADEKYLFRSDSLYALDSMGRPTRSVYGRMYPVVDKR